MPDSLARQREGGSPRGGSAVESFLADNKLVASSSKVVSVGVLMRLADQGLVDVDATIGNYLSAWGSGKPELEVAQLVSNSSGLVSLTDNSSSSRGRT